jgi:formylglycine-generating enzyme required for sulfatase activity
MLPPFFRAAEIRIADEPAMPTNERYIFISYARPDAAVADRVESALTGAGLRVFRDTTSIAPGANWDQTIAAALRDCDTMVLLLSRASTSNRKEVYDEWFPFDQMGKPIVPLYLEDCEPDRRLKAIHHIDMRADPPGALDRLLGVLTGAAPPPSPDALTRFRHDRIAEWSRPRYDLDKRFVNLTLLLDQGPDEMQRWRAEASRFHDLRDVMARTRDDPALVLLGQPGSGKSTLLRRLQLDHSADRLADGRDEVSFFIQLSGYRARSGEPRPEPRKWLADRWAAAHPDLAPLEVWLRQGKALLLLDALNEMPHRDGDDYRELAALWREFARDVARIPGNRILFSCRSLDYGGAFLSSPELPMPQIEIQPMNAGQVREFLTAYIPEHAEAVWQGLDGTPQFTLFQTPFFLKLYCDQIEAAGEAPTGRAALLTGFVRQALRREIIHGLLFQPAAGLLAQMDHDKLKLNRWRNAFELPEGGCLIPALGELAHTMQLRKFEAASAQVRLDYGEARALLAHERPDELLDAGVALNVLDKDLAQSELLFFHQLLQEYFAARQLVREPKPGLVHVEWEAAAVRPALAETLGKLAGGDPLPNLPQTGWEETVLTAAPMATEPASFLRALIAHNLPLAARCAASAEAAIAPELKREIQDALIARTREPKADLRARIAAGEALGLLGDPRFAPRGGPYGAYLAPPLVEIPGGTYPIGLDKSDFEDEKPAHKVKLAPFRIGRLPLTNAEYKLFIEAGGYEDEQWWDTMESKAWLSGEASTDGQKEGWRELRKNLQGQSEEDLRDLIKQNLATSEHVEAWIEIRNWTDEEFEQRLDEWIPAGKLYRQPEFWDDARFNNPAQPVVGITWFEARAYCNWLTANAGGDAIYRLPTEAEFEAAARGSKGRMFPYGNDFDSAKCNTFESHIRRTTPVGIFDNATPEGAFDLSGNAYTWTLSIYDQDRFPYPYRSDDGRENIHQTGGKRVLRGGSWFSRRLLARAAYRDFIRPAVRFINVGCRVVCVVRPPSP